MPIGTISQINADNWCTINQDGDEVIFHRNTADVPEDVQVGASVKYTRVKGTTGRPEAVMVEVL